MNYPSGQYIVRYEGEAPRYKNDAIKISRTPGRDIIEVAPTMDGIHLGFPGAVKNISVVEAKYETLFDSGEQFHPLFLEKIGRFNTLRVMEWVGVNYGTTQGNWLDRPKVSDAFYGTPKGVPLEVIVDLCNRTDSNLWLNFPHAATDEYVRQAARLVRLRLKPYLTFTTELSNEVVWNGAWPYAAQKQYAIEQGRKLWPTDPAPDWSVGYRWYALRSSQIAAICKAEWWMDAKRVIGVLSGQAANVGVLQMGLEALPSDHAIDAIAIAHYFGGPVTATTLDTVFTDQIPRDIDASTLDVISHRALATQFGLDIVSYEGGPGYTAYGDLARVDFVNAIHRDPRMGDAITSHLTQWYANGGGLFNYYASVTRYDVFGCFGVWESIMQAASHKADALAGFPVGINLQSIVPWSLESPFLDAVKSHDQWVPHLTALGGWGQGQPLQADADGWPNSVPVGESVALLLYRNFPEVNG